jgi:hypothetical protein
MPVKHEKEIFVILSDEDRQSFGAPNPEDRKKEPSHEAIAKRAFELYLARGASHGRDLADWLEAERELGAGV